MIFFSRDSFRGFSLYSQKHFFRDFLKDFSRILSVIPPRFHLLISHVSLCLLSLSQDFFRVPPEISSLILLGIFSEIFPRFFFRKLFCGIHPLILRIFSEDLSRDSWMNLSRASPGFNCEISLGIPSWIASLIFPVFLFRDFSRYSFRVHSWIMY